VVVRFQRDALYRFAADTGDPVVVARRSLSMVPSPVTKKRSDLIVRIWCFAVGATLDAAQLLVNEKKKRELFHR
jgi:hypothetical protein